GGLAIHDVGVGDDGRVYFVNTSFNCLATTSDRHSFVPVWCPPFIDALVNEDRCHLNGLAMRDGRPAYVTAVSRSNTIDGWRDRRDGGGVVIDVATDRIVCEGLSMPHSPRWHDGQLWLLNSGTGELGVVAGLESGTGRFEPRAFCPGFLRGLAFHKGHAFVGLSKPRHQRFEGLPLDARLAAADSEAWCGLQVIDLASGACADWFRIDGDVT
ncbi:MAG: TIGR03032 family protein, partial [Xanthomonadales bacterium]|nr:TIGR03032 family protein [Xanthomonadales bacterium]